MEDPNLDDASYQYALASLARLNWASGSVGIVWPSIRKLATNVRRPLRVLDLATGAGDVPLGLWRRAGRANLAMEIRGIDINRRAVELARQRAAREDAAVDFEVVDVLADQLPSGFDVVLSSLFLHHLDEEQAVAVLTKMRHAAERMVLVNDLVRSPRGLLLAHLAARLLTTSDVIHIDAPRSVRAAFTLDEVRKLTHHAGFENATVSRRWPYRMLLVWNRSLRAATDDNLQRIPSDK